MPLMTKRKRHPKSRSSSRRGPGGPPPHLAANAAAEALRRATLAAASGKLTTADREMRLAERLSKIALVPLLQQGSDEPDGEGFRRELEHRINRQRAAERAELDDMKRRNPAEWQAAFDGAVEKAITQARESKIAFWTGDPHLFEEAGPAEHAD